MIRTVGISGDDRDLRRTSGGCVWQTVGGPVPAGCSTGLVLRSPPPRRRGLPGLIFSPALLIGFAVGAVPWIVALASVWSPARQSAYRAAALP